MTDNSYEIELLKGVRARLQVRAAELNGLKYRLPVPPHHIAHALGVIEGRLSQLGVTFDKVEGE